MTEHRNITIHFHGNIGQCVDHIVGNQTLYMDKEGNVRIENTAPQEHQEENLKPEEVNGTAKDTLNQLVEKGLSIVLPSMQSKYRDFWKSILSDEMFMKAFRTILPRGFEGNYNQKLFCNILGFLKEHKFFTCTSAVEIGDFFYEKTVKRYIYNFMPAADNATNSELNTAMLAKMRYLVE